MHQTTPKPYALPDPACDLHPADEKFSVRSTYYFTEAQLLALEVVQLKMRTDEGSRVGKSDLMQAALDFIIADHKTNGSNSWVSRRILSQNQVVVP